MKTLLVTSVMVVLFIAAPDKIEAQKRKAATPSVESSVNAYFRYRVTSESGGALSPTGFRKTNGYEQGFGLYVMEWQAEVLFQQDGYKAGDFFVGYWQNFRVLQQKPGTLDSLIVGNTILFNKGTTVRLTGNATLRKTEKGWRLEGFETKTSQRLATKVTPTKPLVTPVTRVPPETALIAAAEKGDVTTVRTLLAKRTNINANDKSYGGTALIKAAIGGHLAVVQLLLAKGANLEATGGGGQTALVDAASGGKLAVVEALLAKGANVNAVNGRALYESALFGHLAVVQALLAKGADVNVGDETALIGAADRGHLFIVLALLEKGADVNKKGGGRGATALIHAVATLDKGRAGGTSGDQEEEGGSLPIVKALLDKGADVDAKDLNGWTALMYAAGDGHLAIVQTLLDKGANIEAKGDEGWTALMSASESGRLRMVQALLARGANINAKTTEGKTALFAAASSGQLPVVEALLAKGADVDAKSDSGQTALDVANANGHSAIVRFLKGVKTSNTPRSGATPIAPAFAARSLEALSAAVERGESVTFQIKYDYAVSPYHYLHDGILTLSKTSVAFDGRIGDLDFTVAPEKILGVIYQTHQASLIRLKVAVKNKKGDKESKKDLYFYNPGAVTVGSGPGGTGLSIACNRCDDSMNVLYALLQKVRGKSEQ